MEICSLNSEKRTLDTLLKIFTLHPKFTYFLFLTMMMKMMNIGLDYSCVYNVTDGEKYLATL